MIRTIVAGAAAAAALTFGAAGIAGASTPAGKNMLWNGAFDAESLRPWSVMFDAPRFRIAGEVDHEE